MPTEIDKELTIELLVATVHSFSSTHGYSPSMRDLAEALGIPSTATVHKYVKIAKRRNLLADTKGAVRSLRVTDDGRYLLSQ